MATTSSSSTAVVRSLLRKGLASLTMAVTKILLTPELIDDVAPRYAFALGYEWGASFSQDSHPAQTNRQPPRLEDHRDSALKPTATAAYHGLWPHIANNARWRAAWLAAWHTGFTAGTHKPPS